MNVLLNYIFTVLLFIIQIACKDKIADMRIIPVPSTDIMYQPEIQDKKVKGIIQYFVVKDYPSSDAADSILFRYADSCRMKFQSEFEQYSAYFYKQTKATSLENIRKKGKYIEREFEREDLIFHVSCSRVEGVCFKDKYKNGKVVLEKGEKEVKIDDVKQ